MRHFEGILVVLVMGVAMVMGCSSSPESSGPEQDQPVADAGVEGSSEAGTEAGKDAGKDAAPETSEDAAAEASDDAPADSPTEAPDSPVDAPTEADVQAPIDAPAEAAAPGACSPPGPPGNVADCSSLCSTYCEPACTGSGLPGGTGTCNPYLTCDASDPIWLTSPAERAFVLPAETGVHQGLDGNGVTCKTTCGTVTSFAFHVVLGHCAKFTNSGGRSFLQEGADCSSASECLVVQGSQAGTVVRVLGLDDAPAAWVSVQVDESWSGHPCPYSCP